MSLRGDGIIFVVVENVFFYWEGVNEMLMYKVLHANYVHLKSLIKKGHSYGKKYIVKHCINIPRCPRL